MSARTHHPRPEEESGPIPGHRLAPGRAAPPVPVKSPVKSPAEPSRAEPAGPIAWMASHPVASNLLMGAILAAGAVSFSGLEREAWPVVPFNTIEISVAYPGASPRDVEEAVVLRIEEQIQALPDIKSVKSLASQGLASVRAELNTGADIGEVMDEVQAATGRITSFPAAAERPRFRELDNETSMIRLIVSGDVRERALKELAHRIEDELASLPSVSRVETVGTRNDEISIEIPLARLRSLGLTIADVADAVRSSSLDLPAGRIAAGPSEVRVTTTGQRYGQFDFEDIVLISRRDGGALRLGEVAEVRDGFEETDLILRHQGRPAVFVEVYRAEGEQVMDVAEAVHAHLDAVILPALPPQVGVTVWNDDSRTYSERVELLVRNGALGLALVFLALALFLEIRLAVWVVAGLVTAGAGALAVMLSLDLAINTISLFSFVLAVGVIVDDAIVVAEHIHLERQRGRPGLVAAIRGARRIRKPLVFAILTSVAAFTPLLFIPGGIGEVWVALPVILIGMLLISLAESLLILPGHLAHLPGPEWRPRNPVDRLAAWTRGRVGRGLDRFLEGPLDRMLRFATEHPVVVVAGAIGLLVLSVSLVPAGIVPTTFADVVEGDFVTATIEMPDGTPAERTHAVAIELERAGRRVLDRLDRGRPGEAPSLMTGVLVTVGRPPRIEGGGLEPTPTTNPRPNIAAVEFKLLGAEERDLSTLAVVQAWREEVGVLPQVRGLGFSGEVIDLGSPIAAVLSHPDPARLTEIADSVVDGLRGITGVFDVRSDHTPGVRQMDVRLRPEGRALGLTTRSLAEQVRGAFFGQEALRFQRGREETRVQARLPEAERNALTDLETALIRVPAGGEAPLREVAVIEAGSSPPAIRRQDGRQVVTVTAEVDASVISAGQANAVLEDSILAGLRASNPGLTWSFGGEAQQQLESLDALYRGFALAMVAIFALLAIPLGSWTRPFLVMAIIPFGLIGVVLGHLVLGLAISAASFLGFFGLSGVAVNDSLVMIVFMEQRLGEGVAPRDALIEGAKGRFRPIFLTSVTTFLGFTPLILERAIQAQFLVPFAASLGVGVMITTSILMLLIPALMAMVLRVNARPAA